MLIAGIVIILVGLFLPMGSEDGYSETTGLPYSENRTLVRVVIIVIGGVIAFIGFVVSG